RMSWTGLGGTRASLECCFVLYRCAIAECGVESLPIVPHFEVFEHRVPGVCPCGPLCIVDELGLERRKETLDHGVVPAVAFAAHAPAALRDGQQCLILRTRVLPAAIRVMQHVGWMVPLRERHVEGGQWQRPGDRAIHGPADDAA